MKKSLNNNNTTIKYIKQIYTLMKYFNINYVVTRLVLKFDGQSFCKIPY